MIHIPINIFIALPRRRIITKLEYIRYFVDYDRILLLSLCHPLTPKESSFHTQNVRSLQGTLTMCRLDTFDFYEY